jgi:hypothetical protein
MKTVYETLLAVVVVLGLGFLTGANFRMAREVESLRAETFLLQSHIDAWTKTSNARQQVLIQRTEFLRQVQLQIIERLPNGPEPTPALLVEE